MNDKHALRHRVHIQTDDSYCNQKAPIKVEYHKKDSCAAVHVLIVRNLLDKGTVFVSNIIIVELFLQLLDSKVPLIVQVLKLFLFFLLTEKYSVYLS